ncbi:MAG: toll/interleukin-1 receptor domain-containing protein [Ignavibacteria bacterium]|jgi:hypothetical protein
MASATPKLPSEHLFISYATEDWILADWLALKLASEGYKIWYDRIKLLGGESYPRDITEAIKNQTFRVLALLSRNSINKPNPIKERTLALNIARERKIDFLIPINVDGLRATELDFMTSDLTFIPFDGSWFNGICALLKKLQQIDAPRNQTKGYQVISEWLSIEKQPKKKTETIWSNLLPIVELPKAMHRYSIVPEIDVKRRFPNWPFYAEGEKAVWAFSPPTEPCPDWLKEVNQVALEHLSYYSGNAVSNILTALMHKSIELFAVNKGLKSEGDYLYFPNNAVPKNRLNFLRYDGKKSFVNAVGERRFRIIQQKNPLVEESRYHLSPNFKFFGDLFGSPVFRVQIGVFWTDLEDMAIDDKKANRRRKALCKNWWNYQWLSRAMAVCQWLGDGKDEAILVKTDSGNLRISLKPLSFTSSVGIDEDSEAGLEEEDEFQVLEENQEEDDDDTTEPA